MTQSQDTDRFQHRYSQTLEEYRQQEVLYDGSSRNNIDRQNRRKQIIRLKPLHIMSHIIATRHF